MPHTIISGITGSGKTTIAKMLAANYYRQGVGVFVLTPIPGDKWRADFITNDCDKFLKVVFANRNCSVFVDECGRMIGNGTTQAKKMSELAFMGRQWGHNMHFIAQRASMIDPDVRAMCENFLIFKQSDPDARTIAAESACPDFLQAVTLQKGQCLSKIGIDGKCRLIKVF